MIPSKQIINNKIHLDLLKNANTVKYWMLIISRIANAQYAKNVFRNITIIIFHQIQIVKSVIVKLEN
jgi:hypothetical protein